ncbi:hypothetical protein [Maledivibacter halophilus]|uniref:Uncharacterized protein n=1 Tax=Maledivibacter halophilus TaxID=36842 RepID=A0A1T5MQB5_9FIRM|nr:hypothetical protein [Maledivibacter halophilus]SKC90415.1 hypothetical protein SAMN02194393_05159 [Maledivibacter halophilus]
MYSKICLIKYNKKIIPGLIFNININRTGIEFFKLKKGTSDNESKSLFYIGKPKGLKFESLIRLNELYTASKTSIKKEISQIDKSTFKKLKQIYLGEKIYNKLHNRMHILKNRIQISKLNNENYRDLQKELEIILQQLGYPIAGKYFKKGKYGNYRELPTKGYIKVYRG